MNYIVYLAGDEYAFQRKLENFLTHPEAYQATAIVTANLSEVFNKCQNLTDDGWLHQPGVISLLPKDCTQVRSLSVGDVLISLPGLESFGGRWDSNSKTHPPIHNIAGNAPEHKAVTKLSTALAHPGTRCMMVASTGYLQIELPEELKAQIAQL